MGNCYSCQKSLGALSGKAVYEYYLQNNVPLPEGMKKGDHTCMDCYGKFKKGNRAEASEVKESLQEEDIELTKQVPEFKKFWNKNGVIQFKNDKIAILKRQLGKQVEFIIAYDDLTTNHYELKAIDEGKEGGEGITGGISSYYYFQRFHVP